MKGLNLSNLIGFILLWSPLSNAQPGIEALKPSAFVLAGNTTQDSTASTGESEPSTAKSSESGVSESREQLVHGQWWSSFAVQGLDEAVAQGLESNPDIQAIAARLEQMQAGAWQAIAPAFPALSVDVNGSTAPYDSLGFQFGGLGPPSMPGEEPPLLYYTGSSFLNLRVPIDIVGRQAFAYRSNLQEADAAQADGQTQAVQIVGAIANAYLDAEAAESQLIILRNQQTTNQELLDLLQMRFEAGQVTALDILRQKQQLAASSSQIPAAEAQVVIQQQRLRMLLGQPQKSSDGEKSQANHSPDYYDLRPLPPGIETLFSPKNRPDIRSAQTRQDAASSQIMNAYLSLLPSLQLTGNLGYQGILIDELNEQMVYGAGLGLSIPLFTGGSSVASIKQAYAAKKAAELTAESLSNQSHQQIAEALQQEKSLREQLERLGEQKKAAEDVLEESKKRYFAGLSDYQTVLLALQSVHQAEIVILQTKRALFSARIFFHQSIGGEWTKELGK